MASVKVTYRVVKCPHCGKKLGRRNVVEYRLGSPLRVCKKCGKEYIDRDYHELALEEYKDPKPISVYLLVAGMVAVFALLFGAFTQSSGGEGILIGLLAAALIDIPLLCIILYRVILRVSGIEAKRLEKERQASLERLQDPVYAIKLMAAGYPVGTELLRKRE